MNFSCKNIDIMSTYYAINAYSPKKKTYVIALINQNAAWIQITNSTNLVGTSKVVFDRNKKDGFSLDNAVKIINDIKNNLGKFQTLMFHTAKNENEICIPIAIALQEKFPHINFDINMLKNEMPEYINTQIYQMMKKASTLT